MNMLIPTTPVWHLCISGSKKTKMPKEGVFRKDFCAKVETERTSTDNQLSMRGAQMKKSLGPGTLAYPNPVWCVGSYDKEGKPNVMTIAWGGICCSKPTAVTISLRKATYTYASIMERKAYTVNVPSQKYVAEADYFGIASGKKRDKFKDTGLTPVRSEIVDAPYIKEFPLVIECKLIHTLEIGLHTQFIGEIMDVKVDEEAVDTQGQPMMEKIAPFVFGAGIREYWSLDKKIGDAFDIGRRFNG